MKWSTGRSLLRREGSDPLPRPQRRRGRLRPRRARACPYAVTAAGLFFLSLLPLFAEDNTERVIDGVWTNAGAEFYVGFSGTNNTLRILNGGWLYDGRGFIGHRPSASNNLAAVTGAGSLWINDRSLAVGFGGAGNTLDVRGGGGVIVLGNLQVGRGAAASGNTVNLAGRFSFIDAADALVVGRAGSSNLLRVAGGALLASGRSTIGRLQTGTGNRVFLSGPGTFWTNEAAVVVGRAGRENRLALAAGSALHTAGLTAGFLAAGDRNTVRIERASAFVSDRLTVGRAGEGNEVFVADGGFLASRRAVIGGFASAASNLLRVTGAGSTWSNALAVTVGERGGANRLELLHGARAETRDATVGNRARAAGNTVLVKGTNSLWLVRRNLTVGRSGSGNTVTAAGGARLRVDGDVFIGERLSATGNLVRVEGPGTAWTISGDLTIGSRGAANGCHLADRARITLSTLLVGDGNGADGNLLSLSGGALLLSENAFIGRGGSNNRVEIDGTGTVWSNLGALVIAPANISTGHFVVVRNGGNFLGALLDNRSGGTLTVKGGSAVRLTGAASAVPQGGGYFALGTDAGGNNTLEISGGGRLGTGRSEIGLQVGSGKNTVRVRGTNSLWKAGVLIVGKRAAENRLTVSEKGRVEADALVIGAGSGADRNSVTVSGPGSAVLLDGAVSVGGAGNEGNVLSLIDEAYLSAAAASVADRSRVELRGGRLVLTAGDIAVAEGALLAGWGGISGGDLLLSGKLDPGSAAPGLLRIEGNLEMHPEAETVLDLFSAAAYDRVEIAGDITFAGGLTIRLAGGYLPAAGETFHLFSWSGTSAGAFAATRLPSLPRDREWNTSRLTTEGILQVDKTIPEPLAASLLLLAAGLLLFARRRFSRP